MSILELYQLFLKSTGISTDTRSIEKGNLFFSLKGPNFNANKLADEALEKGAIAAVVDEEDFKKNDQYVLVDNGLKALQELANHHRKQFNIPFIGITGSNGKTTTKELIATVLETTYKTHYTKGNFNNHIGVPLTLLSMPMDTEIAIIEMGANGLKDIKELSEIAEPTHGIITNIGKAHLEGFGSLEGVARAKSELYLYLLRSGGKVFVNSSDEHLMRMASRFEERITFPQKGDFYECEYVDSSPYLQLQTGDVKIKTNLIGKYNFYNIAAALCIGKYFSVDHQKATDAIAQYKPTNNRSEVVQKGSNTILLDAYNANPSSMKAAILNFEEMTAKNKVAVLGDMFELGEAAASEHGEIGELLHECHIDKVILVGKEMKSAYLKCPSALYIEEVEDLKKIIDTEKYEQSLILIKGSRGMALETIVEKI